MDRYAEAAADAQRRYDDETRLTSDLRAKIEEFETYIDGSKERWSALCEKLAEYRDALGVSEHRVADAEARFLAETISRERLWTEAADRGRRLEEMRRNSRSARPSIESSSTSSTASVPQRQSYGRMSRA